MPTTDSDPYGEVIRRTLASRTGDTTDADAIAEATLSTLCQVIERLSPVIGSRGVDVLLVRSLHLTSPAFPWLASAGNQRDSAAVLESIRTRLAGSQTNTATGASHALFTTLVELLITLIGESLTERLLSPVWAPPSPHRRQKRRSHHA